MIRIIISITALLIIAWSGYWMLARHKFVKDINDLFDMLNANGWTVERSYVQARGYPNRIDVTIKDPVLTGSNRHIAWQAPILQILTLSYDPKRMIVVWPATQNISVNGFGYQIDSEQMRASIQFKSQNGRTVLDQLIFEANDFSITSDTGWKITGDKVVIAIRHDNSDIAKYQTALKFSSTDNTALSTIFGDELTENSHMPLNIDLDMFVTLADTLGAHSCIVSPVHVENIESNHAILNYGDITIEANIKAEFSIGGYPAGKVNIYVSAIDTTQFKNNEVTVFTGRMNEFLRFAVPDLPRFIQDTDSFNFSLDMKDRILWFGNQALVPLPYLRAVCD